MVNSTEKASNGCRIRKNTELLIILLDTWDFQAVKRDLHSGLDPTNEPDYPFNVLGFLYDFFLGQVALIKKMSCYIFSIIRSKIKDKVAFVKSCRSY